MTEANHLYAQPPQQHIAQWNVPGHAPQYYTVAAAAAEAAVFDVKPGKPLDLPDGFSPLELPELQTCTCGGPSLCPSHSKAQAEPSGSSSPERSWQAEGSHLYTGSSQLAATLQSLGIQIADGEHVQLEAMLADMHISAGNQLSTSS